MSTSLEISTRVDLNNGISMPLLGLGVYQMNDEQVQVAIDAALDTGYRLIDTASFYGNETGVGKALQSASIDQSEIFVTTKVWNADQGYDQTLRAFDTSMRKLGLDVLDLYLVHWPVAGKYLDTWRAMEYLYKEGRVRAVGVSNFLIEHLADLARHSDLVPALNQIEFHPHLQQPALLEYCADRQIQVQAWSPLMQGQVFSVPLLQTLAKKYEKSEVQIVLRWNLQRGISTIPKSAEPHRIADNGDLYDFCLSAEEMGQLAAIDQGIRIGPDPADFDF
ncbi:MAG: aldo/keto reductase [Bacteroidota bacterium]